MTTSHTHTRAHTHFVRAAVPGASVAELQTQVKILQRQAHDYEVCGVCMRSSVCILCVSISVRLHECVPVHLLARASRSGEVGREGAGGVADRCCRWTSKKHLLLHEHVQCRGTSVPMAPCIASAEQRPTLPLRTCAARPPDKNIVHPLPPDALKYTTLPMQGELAAVGKSEQRMARQLNDMVCR